MKLSKNNTNLLSKKKRITLTKHLLNVVRMIVLIVGRPQIPFALESLQMFDEHLDRRLKRG